MGNQACSPAPKTIDCLYEVSSHAGLVPDTSLDPTLASLLSLNSSWALEEQYSSLQHHLTDQQMAAFNQDLWTVLRENTTVSYGGVGVVALALSVLFEVVAHHHTTSTGQRGPEGSLSPPDPDPMRRMFGPDTSSEIASIASEFLKQVPGMANKQDKMAEILSVYEGKLRFELMDLYERMLSQEKGALSSMRMKQWINGAALHVHMHLQLKRLTNTSAGDIYSLSYLHGIDPLFKTFTQYLQRMVKEKPSSAPGPSGLLVVEPLRNISHGVQHRTCESVAIQQALVERFLAAQDVQRGKDFFQSSEDHHDRLMAQHGDFQLKM